MTVAKIHDLHAQGAVAIGRLIPKIDRFDDGELPAMPTCLATRPERESYGARVKSLMGRRVCPRLLKDRVSLGQSERMRVLKVLDRLALRGCGSMPVSRTQWLRLKQLSLFCARDQDWACASGPIIGATTAKLADYLGVNDVNEALSPLLKLGLVALWSPNANGRRSFHVARANCDDETVYGSGWTLAPLILHLVALEGMVDVEQQRLADRQSLVVQTRSMLRSIQQDLMAGAFGSDDIDDHRDLSARFHNAKKGRLSILEECHADAQAMIDRMGDQFRPCAELGKKIPALESRTLFPPYTRKNQSDRFVPVFRIATVETPALRFIPGGQERPMLKICPAVSTRRTTIRRRRRNSFPKPMGWFRRRISDRPRR